MPKRKYDEYGYGIVERNYLVKCPHCGGLDTFQEPECRHCHKNVCPDCLQPLYTTASSGGNSNGNWYQVRCNSCGYLLLDY